MINRKLRLALVGTDSLRGKELKNLLSEKAFPLQDMKFFDSNCEEEFSRLTDFRGEAKVISSVTPDSLQGLDVVFLASDNQVNRRYAKLAAKLGYIAIALGEDFVEDTHIPVVVAGINDGSVLNGKFSVVANPHPVSILLSHLLSALPKDSRICKAAVTVLQPVSAYEEAGIEELATQSLGMLQSVSGGKKLFRAQIAFNLLSQTSPVDRWGFSSLENQIVREVRKVLTAPRLPLTVSVVQAPVFHAYSLMIYLELKEDLTLVDLASALKSSSWIKYSAPSLSCPVSSVAVAGKEKIFVGQLKKSDSVPRSFWLWAAADNLTLGSALNAVEIAKSLASND